MKKVEFRKFYDKHCERVYRFVFFRVSTNRDVAEDLTSEIFMKALRAFEKYDPDKSESAWINTIARNHLANHYRDTKYTDDIDAVAFSLEGEDGNQKAEMNDERRILYEALSKIDKTARKILEMKYIQGYRYKEIAEVLGKTVGAVRVESHRSIIKLRKLIKR